MREKIYVSGVSLFNKFGPRKVSIDMIVKEAWVGKWSFYNHFENKEALYEQVFDDIMLSAEQYVEMLVETYPDPKERFIVDLMNSLDFFCGESWIIAWLMARDKNYLIGKINEEYLEETHHRIIKSIFRDVYEEIFNGEKALMDFSMNIFMFYKHARVMQTRYKTKEEFYDFMAKLAYFLIHWLFDPNFSDLKDVKYSDYQSALAVFKEKVDIIKQYS